MMFVLSLCSAIPQLDMLYHSTVVDDGAGHMSSAFS